MEMQGSEFSYLFTHGVDFVDRRIYLTGEITEESASNVIRALHLLSRLSGPIEIFIQSPGGCLPSTFAIYDTIQMISDVDSPIHTIGTGEVCSGALVLLSAGFTRSATEHIYAMVHSATTSIGEGETHSVLSSAIATDDMNKRMWDILQRHTKRTAAQWSAEAKKEGEIWMPAKELQKRGVIDDIIAPRLVLKKKTVKKRAIKKKNATTVSQKQRA